MNEIHILFLVSIIITLTYEIKYVNTQTNNTLYNVNTRNLLPSDYGTIKIN